MVIEFLTFEVDPSEREQWLVHEERHWSRYLEGRPGFVGKEMWVDDDDPGRVHAVIRWESMEAWDAVPASEIATRWTRLWGSGSGRPRCGPSPRGPRDG